MSTEDRLLRLLRNRRDDEPVLVAAADMRYLLTRVQDLTSDLNRERLSTVHLRIRVSELERKA